ncbi:MAG: metallophosphoesterase, partial [Sphingobacteriales bacterium]
PPIAPDTAKLMLPPDADSVSAPVNAAYNDASGLKRLLMGNNYRKEWATPVKLKTFYIEKEKGGFTIESQGGGKQTTTIRIKDASGNTWAMRSINKDPEKVIPENFRNTFAQDVVYDILSASHPYSAAPVTYLSKALEIPAPKIEYYFVPNDTALGYYRTAFANTVIMLEERDPSKFGEKTDNTWEVFNDRLDKKDVSVEQPQFLKSRMLDIIVADFDRHYEQFKWEAVPGASSKHYLAVPKDRDQAFFLSNGLIMKLFAYSQMPFLKGLRYDIPNAPSFGFVARDIDGLFLNQLNKKDWERTLAGVQANLTDTTIENAVRQMPPEIYSLRGKETADRLKSRRDNIKEAGMDYYDFLAKNVNIPGTNSKEVFKVMQTDTGVAVHVFQEGDSGTWSKIFNRTFRDDETKEIRLYGLNGDDHFRIDPDVSTGIKFRIIGGPGKDSFDLQGPAAKRLYDAASETSTILSRSRTINMISRRPDVNAYSFRESNYSSLRVPTINLGFNIEDGFLAGLGVTATKAGFRQEPFASQHSLSSLFSFIHKAYQVRYSGEMNDVYRHYDVLANAMLVNPALNNFFGFGNESANDTTLPRSFYRVRFSAITGDVAVRKRFFHNKLSFAAGPAFYYYWNTPERNEDRILETPELIGLDSASVYNRKFYAGGRIYAAFNSIDNLLLPTKGIDWQADFSALTALNESSLPLTRLQSSFSLFAPLSSNKRFILVLRLGGGHIFSEHFEYFQALTLGANNFLRGYRKNRFAGSSLAYNSVELRAKLFQVRSKVLPGDLGLVGFNDVGRVWMRGESSAKWHHAYGGGVYYTPFNLVMLSVMMGISEEESLFNISAGAKLNIVF